MSADAGAGYPLPRPDGKLAESPALPGRTTPIPVLPRDETIMQQQDGDLRPSELGQEPVGAEAIPQTPYEVLLGELDQLLAGWRVLVRPHTQPTLAPSRLMDSLPEILPRLIR